MMPSHDLKVRFKRGVLALWTVGVATGAQYAEGATDSAALGAAVRRMIGDAACNIHDQCRTVAFGAKACGGPQSYLAWSTLRSDESALNAAAAGYAASRRKEIERRGIASDCSLVVDPGARCARSAGGASTSTASEAGVCRLTSGAARAAQ